MCLSFEWSWMNVNVTLIGSPLLFSGLDKLSAERDRKRESETFLELLQRLSTKWCYFISLIFWLCAARTWPRSFAFGEQTYFSDSNLIGFQVVKIFFLAKSVKYYACFTPSSTAKNLFFCLLRKISSAAPPRGTWLRKHYWVIERV